MIMYMYMHVCNTIIISNTGVLLFMYYVIHIHAQHVVGFCILHGTKLTI